MDVFCLDKKDKISLYSFIPRKKGLTDICEAFLHGKEHTTWQAVRPALILPLAVMLFIFHFSVH
jgi:hypothetical protein